MSTARDRDRNETRTQREAGLAALHEEYYDRIVRYARVHIGDSPDSEDIAGEVFLKALQSLDSYQERGVPMQAWLFKIAHNLIVDYLRKKARMMTLPVDMETLSVAAGDPVAVAETNFQMERVSAAMQQLTAEQREVVGLRFLGGLASKEVAAIEKLRSVLVAGS